MTAPARFTQGDLKRAAAGAMRAGLHVARIEVDPTGKITIITGRPEAANDKGADEWDDLA